MISEIVPPMADEILALWILKCKCFDGLENMATYENGVLPGQISIIRDYRCKEGIPSCSMGPYHLSNVINEL